MSRIWLKLVVIATVPIALQACIASRASVPKKETAPGTPVEVMEVAKGVLVEQGNYFGTIEPAIAVMIGAEVGGQIVEVTVDEGSRVKKGALLLAMDEEPFRLGEEQARRQLEAATLRAEQLEMSIAVEKRHLEAGLQQAGAAVDLAQSRLAMVEKGARYEEKEQLRAGRNGARASLDNARLELERAKALFEQGAATQQMVDGSLAAFDSATARYEQAKQAYHLVLKGARIEDKDAARAGVRQSEAGQAGAEAAMESLTLREKELEAVRVQIESAKLAVEGAELQRSKAKIHSPLDVMATVAMRNVDPGEMAGPGMPLFELLDLNNVKLVMNVPGMDVNFFKAGAKVLVECVGDPAGKQRWGTVSYVSVKADLKNTTFPVKLNLANEDGALRSGQICETFPELARHDSILLSRHVVLDTQEGKVVMVVEDGLARERVVKVTAVRKGIAAIAEGLEVGTPVIVVGERLVRDGETVRVMEKHPAVGATSEVAER